MSALTHLLAAAARRKNGPRQVPAVLSVVASGASVALGLVWLVA